MSGSNWLRIMFNGMLCSEPSVTINKWRTRCLFINQLYVPQLNGILKICYLSVALLKKECICPGESILERSFWIGWIERTLGKELVEVAHTIHCGICPSMTIKHCIVTSGATILWKTTTVHNYYMSKVPPLTLKYFLCYSIMGYDLCKWEGKIVGGKHDSELWYLVVAQI